MAEMKPGSPFSITSDHPRRFETLLPAEGSSSRIALYRESIRTMPLPSTLWNRFQRACNEGASGQQLADIVMGDPVLSAGVLRSANSAMFGLRTPITNLNRAISHLGYSMVRNIVARHSFSDAATGTGKVYDFHMLWRHGMAVSALAEVVARHIDGCNADEAGTLGLFHDIGRLSFNLLTEYMQPAEPDPDKGHLVYEFERFGCTHIDLGVLLAEHWELPEKIVQGIRYHHHPAHSTVDTVPAEVQKEVLAVFLADLIAVQLGFAGGNPGVSPPHPGYAALMAHTTLQQIIDMPEIGKELAAIDAMEF